MQGVKMPDGTILWNGTTFPALCLDLDGTIRRSKSGGFINGPGDVELFPGIEAKIWEYRDRGYLIFGISNQGAVAHDIKTVFDVEAELDATIALFESSPFHLIKQAFSMADGKCFPYNKRSLWRKPDIGMLAACEAEVFDEGYVVDWDNSLFVGDRPEDQECAKRAGIPFQWAIEFRGHGSFSIDPL